MLQMENTKLWFYAPNFLPFADELFSELMGMAETIFPIRSTVLYGREVTLKRRSSIFTDSGTSYKSTELLRLGWSVSPQLARCKQYLADQLKIDFDYCLVHLYPDEKAAISWHFDREALQTPIVSISLGETRKFQLRPRDQKAPTHEYRLSHGDLFLMKTGCQQAYQHRVPAESSPLNPRINLTFRKIEPQ